MPHPQQGVQTLQAVNADGLPDLFCNFLRQAQLAELLVDLQQDTGSRYVLQGICGVHVRTLLSEFLVDLQASQCGGATLQPLRSILSCCHTGPVSNGGVAAGQGRNVFCRMAMLVCALELAAVVQPLLCLSSERRLHICIELDSRRLLQEETRGMNCIEARCSSDDRVCADKSSRPDRM